MRVVVVTESRLVQDPTGAVWSSVLAAGFWDRYLAVFEEVVVAARLLPGGPAPEGWHRVDAPRVSFAAIPYYVGPLGYLRRWRDIRRAVRGLVAPGDAVLLRVPSPLAALLAPVLARDGRPYAVEIVGDPQDVFSAGAVRHRLRRFFRWHFVRAMRRQVAGAVAVAYVNETTLPARYPASKDALVATYSSIDMPAHAYVSAPRAFQGAPTPLRMAFVGSLEQMYKAPDVLLDALARCVADGLDLRLTMVGGGRHLAEMEARAASLGLTDRVRFLGEVPSGEPIRALLDESDLFILPSRVEGMPRATIEAMARGLPCIGSTIGGNPEILAAEDLVPPGDVDALTAKIAEVATDADRLNRMAARNLTHSRDFAADILSARRTSIYHRLRTATEAA